MEYRILTGTGVTVSRIALGTMTFGGQVNEQDACNIVNKAIDLGITYIDTANSYFDGVSENYVGKAIRGKRDKVILASKVGNTSGKGNATGLSRRHITAEMDKSLKELDTDYLDIYYLHKPDYNTPVEETLETMTTLVKAGKVRYIGLSNFSSWQTCETLWISDKRNGIAPSLTQNVYNLLTRGIEQELVPCLRKFNVGLVIYNPLAGGFLSGKHLPGKPAADTRFDVNTTYKDRYWTDENFNALAKLKDIADEAGITVLELAMRWCASQAHVDSIIAGVTSTSQLEQNAASIEKGTLSEDTLKACDEVWKSVSENRFKYNR